MFLRCFCFIPHRQDDAAEWLRTERVMSWPGTVVERGWRYLRVTLEQHDETEREYAYRRAAVETMLEHERTRALPSWLITFFSEHQPEYLIRTCLRFDLINDALEHSLALVKKVRFLVRSSWLGVGIVVRAVVDLGHLLLCRQTRRYRIWRRDARVWCGCRTDLWTR
jgi:hypothetical protein